MDKFTFLRLLATGLVVRSPTHLPRFASECPFVDVVEFELATVFVLAVVLCGPVLIIAYQLPPTPDTVLERFDRRELAKLDMSAKAIQSYSSTTHIASHYDLHPAERPTTAFFSERCFHNFVQSLKHEILNHTDLVDD